MKTKQIVFVINQQVNASLNICLIMVHCTFSISHMEGIQIEKFMGPTCPPPLRPVGPRWASRPQMGLMFAPWILLIGQIRFIAQLREKCEYIGTAYNVPLGSLKRKSTDSDDPNIKLVISINVKEILRYCKCKCYKEERFIRYSNNNIYIPQIKHYGDNWTWQLRCLI